MHAHYSVQPLAVLADCDNRLDVCEALFRYGKVRRKVLVAAGPFWRENLENDSQGALNTSDSLVEIR